MAAEDASTGRRACTRRFSNATQRWLAVGFFAGCTALAVPAVFDRRAAAADRWFAVLLVVTLLGVTARALVASSVAVRGTEVAFRTLFRTRSFAYGQLRTCRADPVRVGLVGYRRVALSVELGDGRVLRFTELNAIGPDGDTWVDDVARIVTDRIAQASTSPIEHL